MTRRPADFPARTRRLIAERAGYRCSMPECRRQTLGPGTGPRDVACIGIAYHIYSAAPGGPRGTGGLTREQLPDSVTRGPEDVVASGMSVLIQGPRRDGCHVAVIDGVLSRQRRKATG